MKNMNRFHFLLSICCAVLVYVCISVLAGQEGIWAYNQLKAHKIFLSLHVEALQRLNRQLVSDDNALRSDSDVIAAYAKKMGFVRDGERLVKISGISETPAFVYDPGTRVMRPEIIFVPEWIAKSIAFLIFILYNLPYSLLCVLHRYDTAKI